MGITRSRLRQWPINQQQRAAMLAAQQQVERVLREGMTDEQRAQVREALDAPIKSPQARLPLQVKP